MRRQDTRRGGTSSPAKAKAPAAARASKQTAGKARPTPERDTAKARTAGGSGSAAGTRTTRPTPEAQTAKARTSGRGAVGTKARPAPAAKLSPADPPATRKARAGTATAKAAPAAKGTRTTTAGARARAAAAPKAGLATAKKTAARTSPATKKPAKPKATPSPKAAGGAKKTVAAKAQPRAKAVPAAQKTTRAAPRRATPTVRGTQRAASRDRSQPQEPGVRELDWQHMAAAARELAEKVAHTWSPEIVVGVAKGGVFAGQEVAQALRVPFFPVRVGKRSRDAGHPNFEAAAEMPAQANGRRVLVVDDIAGSGATLQAAVADAEAVGAAEVRTATLVVREGGFLPDFFSTETADLVVFPWDYEPSPGAVGSADASLDDDEAAGAHELYETAVDDDDDLDRFGV